MKELGEVGAILPGTLAVSATFPVQTAITAPHPSAPNSQSSAALGRAP